MQQERSIKTRTLSLGLTAKRCGTCSLTTIFLLQPETNKRAKVNECGPNMCVMFVLMWVRFHSSCCTCCRAQSALDLIKQPELQRRARKERGLSASGPRLAWINIYIKWQTQITPLTLTAGFPWSLALGVSDKGAYCLRFGLKSWINDLRIEIHFRHSIIWFPTCDTSCE